MRSVVRGKHAIVVKEYPVYRVSHKTGTDGACLPCENNTGTGEAGDVSLILFFQEVYPLAWSRPQPRDQGECARYIFLLLGKNYRTHTHTCGPNKVVSPFYGSPHLPDNLLSIELKELEIRIYFRTEGMSSSLIKYERTTLKV